MWHLLVQSEKKRLGTVEKKRLGTKNVRYSRIFKASTKNCEKLLEPKVCRYYFGNIRYNINRA